MEKKTLLRFSNNDTQQRYCHIFNVMHFNQLKIKNGIKKYTEHVPLQNHFLLQCCNYNYRGLRNVSGHYHRYTGVGGLLAHCILNTYILRKENKYEIYVP